MTPLVISQSTLEPLTLEEAARNLRVDGVDDSPPNIYEADRIRGLIMMARECCEQELEASLIRKVLEVAQCSWWAASLCANAIELPLGPVRAIVSVKYTDVDGAEQTLAADRYRYSPYERTPALLPAHGVRWPLVRGDLDSVRVRYEVGYPSDDSPADDVPRSVIEAMHLLIAHGFKNREAVDDNRFAELPLGVRAKLFSYRRALGV